MSSSSYHSIYSPPCFYRIYSKEFSGHAVPIICPLCLETVLQTFIPMMIQKLLFSRSPMTSTLLSRTVGSQASSFLSSQQHRAQPNSPLFLHICPHPKVLSTPLRVSANLTGHSLSPFITALVSLTMKCWSAQDLVQRPLSFWAHLYTLAT